jgi:geranylgeranyl pyrophosphate synthase
MESNMANGISTIDFNTRLRRKAQSVNYTLRRILDSQQINNDLKEALRYTLGAPGKRVRSVLVLWCCELVSGRINSNAEIASAAIEMVHTYSLIHDDLPAMDDDDIRRGQPTCHKAFDEATAILTGDALLTLAFGILADGIDQQAIVVKLISQLAQDAGADGMIAGQMADLRAEKRRPRCSDVPLLWGLSAAVRQKSSSIACVNMACMSVWRSRLPTIFSMKRHQVNSWARRPAKTLKQQSAPIQQ